MFEISVKEIKPVEHPREGYSITYADEIYLQKVESLNLVEVIRAVNLSNIPKKIIYTDVQPL